MKQELEGTNKSIQVIDYEILHKNPINGIPIIEPERTPNSTEIIMGYEILNEFPSNKYFVKPDPKRMNTIGWVSVVLTFLCFWPATCVPCCMTCSYNKCQRPVYGYPKLD